MNRIIFSGFAAVVVIAASWYWVQMQPANAPVQSGAVSGSGGDQVAPMADVLVPSAFSEAAVRGEEVFNANCASCHGKNAAGQDGVAPPLVHRIYEPSHHADMAFVLAARNGVRAHHWSFGNMPAITPSLSDADLSAVILYVRELQRANDIS